MCVCVCVFFFHRHTRSIVNRHNRPVFTEGSPFDIMHYAIIQYKEYYNSLIACPTSFSTVHVIVVFVGINSLDTIGRAIESWQDPDWLLQTKSNITIP